MRFDYADDVPPTRTMRRLTAALAADTTTTPEGRAMTTIHNHDWLESVRPAWLRCVPREMAQAGGKMGDAAGVREFAQIHDVAAVIAEYEGYEVAGRMGGADRRSLDWLRSVMADGFTVLVYVWDSNTKFALRADGSEARAA